MGKVDLTVRGAGVFGLSVAFCAARRGAQVRVVDPHGVAAGASGGIVGALAPHTPENWNDKKAFQLRSLLAAADFWADVARIGGGDPGYARTGRLQAIADDCALDLAHQRSASAREIWRDDAVWQVVPASAHPAWAPASATGLLIHDTLSARVHPRQATLALAQAVSALGGQITPDAPDEGQVLWASGLSGLQRLSDDLGHEVGNGVKGQAALLRCDMADQPQLFAETLHLVPHSNGTVAVGSTSERLYEAAETTDAALDDIIARARQICPALTEAPVMQRWAGVRPRARSRAPMLGAWPGRPGHFVANGGFKIGFGMAPEVGEVMADLLLEGHNRIPEPFEVRASLPRLAAQQPEQR